MTTIDMSRPQRASEDRTDEVRRTLEGVIGVPATEGNLVDVLVNGDRSSPRCSTRSAMRIGRSIC
jgi:hypothetical protein